MNELAQEFLERRRANPALSAATLLSEFSNAPRAERVRLNDVAGWLDDGLSVDDALERLHAASPAPAGDIGLEATVSVDDADSESRDELFDRRYKKLRKIGEGGFGSVYLVEDTLHGGKQLALKVIKTDHATAPDFEARFQNEIIVLRALAHSGIPRIFNDGKTEDGEVYYTMAYVEGTSLDRIIAEEAPFDPERIVRLTRQILAVLEYAHEAGVVHRDLKPSNIMIVERPDGDEPELVQVLDFGIAKVLKSEGLLDDAASMNTVAAIGTPHYMAPEQVRGKDIDGRADLYALGVLVYQMCSGGLPFSGDTLMEILAARLEQSPKPLEASRVPPWLRDVVMGLLERERERRPTTAQLRRSLEKLSTGDAAINRKLSWIAVAVLAIALGLSWQLLRGKSESPTTLETGATPELPALTPGALPRSAQLELPADGLHLNTRKVTVTGNAAGLDEVMIQGDKVAVRAGRFSTVVQLDEGLHEVIVRDPEARSDAAPLARRSVVVDLTAPTIEWRSAPGTPVSRSGATESFAVSTARVELDGIARDAAPGAIERIEFAGAALAHESDGSFRATCELNEDGEHRFQIEAFDRAGNSQSFEILLIRDTAAPTLTVSSPSNGLVTDEEALDLVGNVDDTTAAVLRLNGSVVALDSNGGFRVTVKLARGTNSFELLGEDVLGQRSAATTLEIVRRTRARVPAGFLAAPSAEHSTSGVSGWARAIVHSDTAIELLLVDGRPDASAFYATRTEVTWSAYRAFASATRRALPEPPAFESTDDHPVVGVEHDDAVAFCAWLGGRLPSHEEWEWMAGGGDERAYPWGDTWVDGHCNADAEGTAASGSFPDDRSWCGILDLAGNVSEWCTNPGGAADLRGGSWASDRTGCLISARKRLIPKRTNYVGFRVVITP